ncbi:MAG: hypothetical protein ACJATN_001255 [Neolewinella sp.]|jgi:hypothetical protein
MRLGFFSIALFFTCCLTAQNYESRIHYKVKLGDEEQLHQLILLDYTKLLGTALEVDEENIRFNVRSATEVSIIPTSKLRFLGVFKEEKQPTGGLYSTTQPVGFTDLTYEPTALPYTSKGEVKVINLLYATTEWSLNEHYQIGVGLGGPLGILTTQRARWSLSPLIHVGVSNKMLYVPLVQSFSERLALLGDVHAMLTIGTSHRFLSIGTGLLYDNTSLDGTAWAHRMALGVQLSKRWTVYTEALMVLTKERRFRRNNLVLLPTLNAALSIRRHRWNFGIATVQEEGLNFLPPPIPYVGYSYYW